VAGSLQYNAAVSYITGSHHIKGGVKRNLRSFYHENSAQRDLYHGVRHGQLDGLHHDRLDRSCSHAEERVVQHAVVSGEH